MRKTFLSILCAMAAFSLHSQNNLSGRITDRSTNMPLEQVSIYLPDLEKGSITDENGDFTLGKLPLGTYKVVASYIGFQSFSQNITIQEGQNRLNIMLLPSAIEMEEVIVSTPFHKLQRDNVMKVEFAKISDLKSTGPPTLIEGIGKIPGVGVVSTGVGIGKPVIRGLTSNRVLVYTQGIRLENQQFGAEHGLGVNEAGIESVEVIKGPASLLYGSDAMGGVLYLNPERFAPAQSTEGDVNFNYNTNTRGFTTGAGIKSSGEKLRFLARVAANSHIDYTGGDGVSVTNTRFNEKDLKMGLGFQNTIFRTEVRYNYNESNIGIPEAIGAQSTARTPEMPHQELNSHILSSKTKLFFENSSLDVTLGYIANGRKEFEEHHHDEGEEPHGHEEEADDGHEEGEHTEAALDMDLKTFNYNIQYQLPKWNRFETIVGVQGIYQTNSNYGEEVLIPDATTQDFGVLGTTHYHLNSNNDFQFGIRFDRRRIESTPYGQMGEEGYIAAINRSFNSFNGAFGYKSNFSDWFTGRFNIATGFRAPNLAELTSYGGHAGANRFEIGNPDLKNEHNIQLDLALEFKNEHVELFVNGFHNSINNYIFIAPDGTFLNGRSVYRYVQQDATLYGGEIGFHFHPHPYDWLHIESSYQTVLGELDKGAKLPLIPANTLTNTLRVEFVNYDSWLKKSNAFITLNNTFKQNRVAENETVSPAYSLLDAGFGGEISLMKKAVKFNLTANNLLDKKYIAHLSRLKPDGMFNMGRSITLGATVLF